MTGTVIAVGEDVKTNESWDDVRICEFGTPMKMIESEGEEHLLFSISKICNC